MTEKDSSPVKNNTQLKNGDGWKKACKNKKEVEKQVLSLAQVIQLSEFLAIKISNRSCQKIHNHETWTPSKID